MKKTLALVLSALMVAMSIPTFALDLEAPETLDENPAAVVEAETLEDDLGTLIWAADFENEDVLKDNTDKLTKAYGSYYNEDYPVMAGLYLRDGQQTNAMKFSIADGLDDLGGDGKVLKLETPGNGSWRMLGMKSAELITMPGTYTCTYDIYSPGRSSGFISRVYGNGVTLDQYMNTAGFSIGGTDKFYTTSFSWTCGTKETFDFLSKGKTAASEIGPVAKSNMYGWADNWPFYGQFSEATFTAYIDNMKIYYKPANVVTFDMTDVPAPAAAAIAASIPLKQVIAVGDPLPEASAAGSGYAFLGWLDGAGQRVTTASADLVAHPELEELGGFDISANTATTFTASEEGNEIVISKTAGDIDIAWWEVEGSNEFCFDYDYDDSDPSSITVWTNDQPGIIKVTAWDENDDVHRTVEIHVNAVPYAFGGDNKVTVEGSPMLPGLNIFNGSTEPWSFDDGNPYFEFAESSAVAEDPDDASNKVWQVNGTGGYNSIAVKFPQMDGVPYNISFKRKSFTENSAGAASATTSWWTSNGNKSPSYPASATSWGTYTFTNVKASGTVKMTFNHKNNGSDASGTNIDWYDDWMIVPWYKITYHELDGTETVEWVDPTATEYVPKDISGSAVDLGKNKLLVYDGWNDGTTAEKAEVIYLINQNVDLYPVYSETPLEGKIVWDSLGTYNLTSNSNITVVDKFGIAEITGNGTKEVSVKGLGYNGEIVIDGTTYYLVGNHNWKPGVNLFTGTDAAFDFEGFTAADLNKLYFTNAKNISDNPAGGIALINDGTNSFLKLQAPAGGTYPSSRMNLGTAIETARPMQMSAKAHGAFASFWIMSQGSGGTDIVYQFDPSTLQGDEFVAQSGMYTGKTYSYGTFTALGVEAGLNNSGDVKELYIDDLSIIPAYKITYVDKDGGFVSEEYILRDEEGALLTEWYPEAKSGVTYYIDGVEVNEAAPYTLAYKDFTVKIEGSANAITFGSAAIQPTDATFTVPTPAELDITIDNFVTWLDPDGKKCNPGTELTTAAYLGATFTPFAQDASKPAMAFSYEMNDGKDVTGNTSLIFGKSKAVSYVDGIGTFTNTAYGEGNGDVRIQTPTVTAKDASEYYLFVIREKIEEPENPAFEKMNTGLYFIPAGHSYNCNLDGCTKYHAPGTGSFQPTPEWQVKVVDLKALTTNYGPHSFGNKLITPWDLSQLWFDIGNAVPTKAEQYLYSFDYLRMYRAGVTTVNYYDGDTLLFSDEGRGVGTGYALRSEYEAPEKANMVFAGWADAEGKIYEGNVVDLTGDLDVYAVYEDSKDAPITNTVEFAIRTADALTNNESAIRFKGLVSKDEKADLDEYGFIVTTAEKMDGKTEDDFVIGGTVKSVQGAAYIKGEKDLIFDEDTDFVTFACACYGIKAGKFDVDILARTYALYTLGGKSVALYGSVASQNIMAIAKSCKDAAAGTPENDYYLANAEALDAIIANGIIA